MSPKFLSKRVLGALALAAALPLAATACGLSLIHI